MKAISLTKHANLETYTARIIALGLIAACLLLTLTGCKQQTAAAPLSNSPPAPVGVYALVSVDGQPVPCTINHEGTAMNVQSGGFAITADGHCASTMVVSVGDRKDMKIVRPASYTQSGAELTMTWEGAGMTTGKIATNTFTMENEGMVFVYRK